MAGDRTAIVAGGEGRNTPAAAHVASLALAGRASVASSLHRAARLATGSEHADGLAYPWHRRPPTTLAALRAGLADRYAVATANASVNAIRGALRAAWLSGDMDRAMLERSLAALRQVRGNAAPGRALSPVEARELFEAAAGDRNHAAGARDAALLAPLEQIRAAIGCLDLVSDAMRERRLDDLPGMIRLLGRPVPKRRPEPMRHDRDRSGTA